MIPAAISIFPSARYSTTPARMTTKDENPNSHPHQMPKALPHCLDAARRHSSTTSTAASMCATTSTTLGIRPDLRHRLPTLGNWDDLRRRLPTPARRPDLRLLRHEAGEQPRPACLLPTLDRKADIFADLASPVSPLRLRSTPLILVLLGRLRQVASAGQCGRGAGRPWEPLGRAGAGEHQPATPAQPPPLRIWPAHFLRRQQQCRQLRRGMRWEREHRQLAAHQCAPHRQHLPIQPRRGGGDRRCAATALSPGRARIWHWPLWPHGSIMRGGGATPTRTSVDAAPLLHSNFSRSLASCPTPLATSGGLQEITRAVSEWYQKGRYTVALQHYDHVVALCSDNAACRGNRAAGLIGLDCLAEAFRKCEEADGLDLASGRAHGRLAGLCLRPGMVEKARTHFTPAGSVNQSDPAEWQKLHEVEIHQGRCMDARKIGDWKSVLREADAAIAIGGDSSRLLLALRSEALLWLHKLEEANSTITSLLKLDNASLPSTPTKVSE